MKNKQDIIKLKIDALINKIERLIDIYIFDKGEIDMQNRKGFCHRCGLCCKILFTCPFYKEIYPFSECIIYEKRSRVCKLFPMSEKDLRVIERCGHYFENKVDKIDCSELEKYSLDKLFSVFKK